MQHARASTWLAAVVLAGCAAPPPPPAAPAPQAPRSYVVLLENEDGSTGKVTYTNAQGTVQIEQAQQAIALRGSATPYAIDAEQLRRDTQAAVAAQPRLPRTFVLYFEVGDARINKASEALLPQVLDEVRARPAPDLSITGHTDTAGSAALNESLSLRRAEQVSKLLRAASSAAMHVEITSHGERNLLVPTPDNTAEPRNRRVEVTVR